MIAGIAFVNELSENPYAYAAYSNNIAHVLYNLIDFKRDSHVPYNDQLLR